MRAIQWTVMAGLVGALSLVGCSAAPDDAVEASEATSESLSVFGRKLVGDFHYGSGENFYEAISLASNGKYTATWKPCPINARCASRPESGRWSTRSTNTLVLRPSTGRDKIFTVGLAGDGSGFKMTANGKTERLDRDVPVVPTCSTDSDCAADEECRFVSLCPPPPPGGVSCLAGTNKCVKVAQAGESCGFRTQSIECARGLDCRWVSGPLDALTCARHLAQAGEFCGGIAGIQCAPNTHCQYEGTFPDAGGTCIPCPIPLCAAPPAGCHYESDPVPVPPGECRSGCGRLVCDGSDL